MGHTDGPEALDEALRCTGEQLAARRVADEERDHRAELSRLTSDADRAREALAAIGVALGAASADREQLVDLQGRILDELARIRDAIGAVILAWRARGGLVDLADSQVAPPVAHEDGADLGEVLAKSPPPAPASDAEVVEPAQVADVAEVAVALPSAPQPVAQSLAPIVSIAPIAPIAEARRVEPVRAVDAGLAQRDLRSVWSDGGPPTPILDEWDREDLGGVLERLGPPRVLTAAELGPEIDRLDAAIDDEAFAVWRRFPPHVQRLLISLCTCRARHVQERVQTGSDGLRINTLFSLLTRYSAAEQPGYVNGLSRNHAPKGPSWLDDARTAWSALRDELPEDEPEEKPNPQVALRTLRELLARPEFGEDEAVTAMAQVLDSGITPDDVRLVDLVAPRAVDLQSALGKLGRFKRLRRAIRERADQEEAEAAGEAETDTRVPADWALWGLVRGRRASIVGGDQREESRQRIERAFEFASLEWVGSDHVRVIQGLAQSVRSGGMDLVILLRRFISHEIERILTSACSDAKVPCVVVDRGYGVTQVRLGLERALAQKAS